MVTMQQVSHYSTNFLLESLAVSDILGTFGIAFPVLGSTLTTKSLKSGKDDRREQGKIFILKTYHKNCYNKQLTL